MLRTVSEWFMINLIRRLAMRKCFGILVCMSLVSGFSQIALADDEFRGVIESRPDTKVGTWTVGGKSVEVTENTKLDEEHGPLTKGACAKVEIEDGKVKELESKPAKKCKD
jgi:hypothetical protein